VMLLLDLVLQQGLVLPVKAIRFRAVRPTVDLGPVYLRGKREGPQVTLWSADHENYLGINAIAALGEAP
jgi:hypothetical protein